MNGKVVSDILLLSLHPEHVTFPRFHRHLYKEEQDEIGGQDEH